jgi:hypothetical protein
VKVYIVLSCDGMNTSVQAVYEEEEKANRHVMYDRSVLGSGDAEKDVWYAESEIKK